MDSGAIRSDDFAGLLAALSKGVSHQNAADSSAHSFSQPVYPWQQSQGQLPLHNSSVASSLAPAASSLAALKSGAVPQGPDVVTMPSKIKTSTIIIIGVLGVIVLIFAIIAWMRSNRMKEESEDEDEDEKNANELYLKKARKETRTIPPPSSALAKKRISKENVGTSSGKKSVDFIVNDSDEEELKLKKNKKQQQQQLQHQKRPFEHFQEEEEENFVEEFSSEEENEVNAYVSRNLREFAKQKSNIIDISGLDLPVEFPSPPPINHKPQANSSSSFQTQQPAASYSIPEHSSSAPTVRQSRIVAEESPEVLDYAKKREALFKESLSSSND